MIRLNHDSLRVAALCMAAAFCPGVAHAADAVEPRDFLQADINPAIDPGVDFFEYANGGWLAQHPIPASESAWGIGNAVNEQLYVSLRGINERAAQEAHPAGSDQQKISDFWTTAMDTAKADRLGVHPLDGELARVDAVRGAGDVLDTVFAWQPLGVDALFGVGVGQDEKNSERDGDPPVPGRPRACRNGITTSTRKRASRRSAGSTSPTSRACSALLGRDPAQAKADAGAGDGVRDRAGDGLAQARGPARSGEELQQDDAGRADREATRRRSHGATASRPGTCVRTT